MSLQASIPQYQLYGQTKTLHTDLLFHIQKIETYNEKYGCYHHPHRHPNLYQMVWVTKGTGIFKIDTEEYPMSPNCLYTLSPNIVHTCKSSADMEGYILHFSTSFIALSNQQKINTFHFGKAFNIDIQEVTQIYTQIYREFNQIRKGREQFIQSLISMLLIYKERLSDNEKTTSVRNGFQVINSHFQQLVDEHFTKQKKLTFYANLLNISPAHLKDSIKKTTGLTASELIQKRVILEAKRQLIYSQLSVSEIAFALGFSDANYFWKYFRRYVGCSPGEFRKQRSINQ